MPACPSSLLDASYTHLPGAVAGLGSAARCKRGIAKHGREGANIGGRTRGGGGRISSHLQGSGRRPKRDISGRDKRRTLERSGEDEVEEEEEEEEEDEDEEE